MKGNGKRGRAERSLPIHRVYYSSFIGLVVAPLVIVLLGAALLLWFATLRSARETIGAFQDSVTTTIANDVRQASLQLSHFLYVNDGAFIQYAVDVRHAVLPSERFEANEALAQAFNGAMVPSQSILAGNFYMRDGTWVSMKDEVCLADAEARASAWYGSALNAPNTVTLGGYDSSRTRIVAGTQKQNQLILVTAVAPNYLTDLSGEVELLAYFTASNAGPILQKAESNPALGRTVILDGGGNLLYGDFGQEALRTWLGEYGGRFQGFTGFTYRRADPFGTGCRHDFLFSVQGVPGTDWIVVTFVPAINTIQGFFQLGMVLVAVAFLLLGLFFVFSRYFLRAIVRPLQTIADGMNRLSNDDRDVQIEPAGHRELRTLMETFNQTVRRLDQLRRKNEEIQHRKHMAEFQALQMQINPHFLVNSMNSIRFMAQMAGFESVRRMAEALIRIISCSFRSAAGFYTVREDLEILDSFAYIMRIRYSDSFQIRYDLDESCLDYKIPRLLLQPVVENSVIHGFEEMNETLGSITVTVRKDGGSLSLGVWDNGRGMSRETIEEILTSEPKLDKGTSIGLANVLSRIRLYYGDAARMRIESTPGFTKVELCLPLSQLEREEESDASRADR